MHSMMRFLIVCLSTCTLMMAGAGCGSNDSDNNNAGTGNNGGGGSGDFSTSVDGAAEIGPMARAQKNTLCEDVNNYARSLLPDNRQKVCTIIGIALTARDNPAANDSAQDSCADKRDECLSGDDNFIEDDCFEDVTSQCDVTVNEYARCVNARVLQVKAIFDKVPACSGVTLDDLGTDYVDGFLDLPEDCKTIQTRCPDLLDDDDIFDDNLYDDYDVFK